MRILRFRIVFFSAFLFILGACTPKAVRQATTEKPQTPPPVPVEEQHGEPLKAKNTVENDGIIEVIFLQINDVYEIAPLQGGKVGGLARAASLYQQLKEENPNTLFVLSGDFLSPSLLGTLKYQGERIKGKQMVEVLNVAGVQVVTFGNHEFDLKEHELQARINESNFMWVSSNVRQMVDGKPQPFYKENGDDRKQLPAAFIWEVQDADGTVANIGLFGVTLGSNPKDWVYYLDPFEAALQAASQLEQVANVVVGITHLEMVQDLKLASMLPGVPLLMGGHDHDNMIEKVGKTVVAKADANAKTAYVHRMTLNTHTGEVSVRSDLVSITPEIPDDPATSAVVNKWMTIQDQIIGQVVADPYAVVYHAEEPLDGRESSIRNGQTNMGAVITAAMVAAARQKPIQGAIMNSGGVRIDDQLSGDVLAIDWFRTLPFGGQVWEIDIRGSLLKKVLDVGMENKGTGGYLQWYGIQPGPGGWLIQGQPLEENSIYHIAVNDFLLSGYETGLDFFTPQHPDILKVDKPDLPADRRYDIRKTVIEYLLEQ